MGGSSKSVTVGYKYYVGMHMVLCHGPIDKLLRIQVDERDVWLGSRNGGQITINQPEIFGGESREGGIQGVVDFETGHAGQGQNSYLVSKLGALVPAFRGVVGMVLRQVYMGLNPYLKSWSFRLQRIHVRQNGLRQWYDSKAEIRVAGQFKQRQAILFCIDTSGSMNTVVSGSTTRLQLVKSQLVDIIAQINVLRKDSKVKVDLAICPFGPSYSSASWIDAQDADFTSAINYVNGLTANGGTNFTGPMTFANYWFGTNANTGGRSDTMLLITDGLPDPVDEFANTLVVGDNLINRKPPFGAATNSSVDIYCINVDLGDTTYTQQMDNTSADGVPVITSTDTSALYNAVFFAVMGDSSAMNPAHIIRECLTDPLWGMGYLDSDMDDVSFMAAADKLYSENMGISIIWDTQSTIEDFIKLIARHIDATLYVDRITGKFVLKLIRSDYDESTLITLDESNIDNVSDFVRPAFGELTNSVTVSYWNAGIGDTSTLTVQDIALAQQQGANIGTSVSYEGFVDAITASRAAQRDLTALSTPIASCTIITNRIAENLNIGSVFKWSWKDYDISNMVMRVTSIAFGDGKTNRIRIQCAQDVFSLPDEAYVVPPPPAWEDPTQEPSPANIRSVFEVPYLELVQRQGQTAVDNLLQINNNPDAGYVAAGAVRPASGLIAARLFTNNGSGYEDVSNLDFAPGAVLAEDIDQMATTFAISDLVESENIQLGTWFQMGDELMSVEAISSSSITVKRGCLDTVPVAHTTGAGLVFWDVYAEADPTEYVASDVVAVKVLTNSGSGQLPLGGAPEDVVTLRSRAIRPYPPGNWTINGEYFPAAVAGTLVMSWASRNRVQQTGGTLIGFTDGDITPETGTTYKVTIEDAVSGVILHTVTGITTTNTTIPSSVMTSLPNNIRIRLYSVRGGYDSYMSQVLVTENSGVLIVFTDFSPYATGAFPTGWTKPWAATTSASGIVARSGSTSGKALQMASVSTGRTAARWDGAWQLDDVDLTTVFENTGTNPGALSDTGGVLARIAGSAGSESCVKVSLQGADAYSCFSLVGEIASGTAGTFSSFFGTDVDGSAVGFWACRLRAKGGLVMGKVWRVSGLNVDPTTNEPPFWHNWTQTSVTTGKEIGVNVFNSGVTTYFDRLRAVEPNDDDIKPIELIGAHNPAYTSASASSIVFQIPPCIIVGDLLVITLMRRTAITMPAGWTLVNSASCVDGTTTQWTEVYTKVATSTEVGGTNVTAKTITVTCSPAGRLGGTIMAFRAKDGSQLEAKGSAVATVTSAAGGMNVPLPSLVAAADDGIAIGAGSMVNQVTTGTSYVDIVGNGWMQVGRRSGAATDQPRMPMGIKRINNGENVNTSVVMNNAVATAQQWATISVIINKL